MTLGERLQRLDNAALPAGAGWTWTLPSTPRWVRWLGYVGGVVGLLAIIFLDWPWSTVIITVDAILYLGLIAYYKRRSSAGSSESPEKP